MSDGVRILVVEDEPEVRETLRLCLVELRHQVVTADSGMEALRLVEARRFDIVLLDLRMPGMDGLAVLEALKGRGVTAKVVILTGHAEVESAVTAMKLGAQDYLQKPIALRELDRIIRQAVESIQPEAQPAAPPPTTRQAVFEIPVFIGEDPKIRELRRTIEQVAPTDATVLILGETGTGKELVAGHIHGRSPRAARELVAVDCPSIPESLFESELFGHERGAFTGAVTRQVGKLEAAAGGTLFLDEVAELPIKVQSKLLRFLQDRKVTRIGATVGVTVDTRVISATNVGLEARAREGTFRPDLFYRLSVVRLHLPPLRERTQDIPLLANYFVTRFCQQPGIRSTTLSEEALGLLTLYAWPGNVRELENVIQEACILTGGQIIMPESLPPRVLSYLPSAKRVGQATLSELDRQYILDVLNQEQWNITRAADVLGIHRATLYRKITSLGLRPH